MSPLLDNVMWHTLSGPHAAFAVGTAEARRYAPGFSPIAGFADPGAARLRRPGRVLRAGRTLLLRRAGRAPRPQAGASTLEATIFKMVWDGRPPADDEAPEAVPLGPAHVPRRSSSPS